MTETTNNAAAAVAITNVIAHLAAFDLAAFEMAVRIPRRRSRSRRVRL